MTDKDRVFGSHLNDSKPRMAGRIPLGGYDWQLSSTEGPDPAPGAQGHKIPSTKNIK